MAALTAAYAGYALAKPGHLGDAMEGSGPGWDLLARTYGVRDLATSALALSARPELLRAAATLRIAGDLGDCLLLGTQARTGGVRAKVCGVTAIWAALNALAWALDERG